MKAMSPTPSLLDVLERQLARIGTPMPPFLRKEKQEVHRTLAQINKLYAEFYRKALPIWQKDEAPRPTMIQDIPFLLSRKRGVPAHDRHLYLLMDGMRWDLWEKIKQDFFGKMPDRFRVVREESLWAHQPTTTSAQLPHLEQALREAYPEADLQQILWKISGIDERIHMEKGGLEHLFANVVRYLELELLFRLLDLPSRPLLIFFADHGFIENPAFDPADKYGAERYIHGTDSPFEVIVPWAWVLRL